MKAISSIVLAAIVCGSSVVCGANDQDWISVIQQARTKQAPVHVEWMVTRNIAPNPEMAKLMAADYEQKIEAAKKANNQTQADSLQSTSEQVVGPIAKGRHVTFTVKVDYVNNRRFLAEQVFSPDTDAIKLTYFCSGEKVYCMNDQDADVEIKSDPDKFLEELMRGLPSFALPERYLKEVNLAQATITDGGSTRTIFVHVSDFLGYQFVVDSVTAHLISACIQEGTSPKLLITAPKANDPVPTLHFDQFNNGGPQIEEEWRLVSEQPIVDVAKVDTEYHMVFGYAVTDWTSGKPVTCSSAEFIRKR